MNHSPLSRVRSRATAVVAAAALAFGCAPTRTDIREPSPVAAPEPPGQANAPDADDLARPELAEPTPTSELAPPEQALEQERDERTASRERIVEAARTLLGSRTRLDCSGYVLAAYRRAGLTPVLPPSRTRSESLRIASREVTTPEPGDLAFFHDTYDRNRNGKMDDGITHVALVESVEGSTVTLLHRGLGKVERFRMDLERPRDRAVNDPVRVRRPRDTRTTRYLSGELFTAFGELLDGPVTQSFQARPASDTGGRHPPRRWRTAKARTSRSEPAPSRSTRRPSSAGCSGSCPPTRRSSSRSSATGGRGAPSSLAP